MVRKLKLRLVRKWLDLLTVEELKQYTDQRELRGQLEEYFGKTAKRFVDTYYKELR